MKVAWSTIKVPLNVSKHAVWFVALFCRLLAFYFYKVNFLKKISLEHYQSGKLFGSRSGPTYVDPDLGSNRLQRLSADDFERTHVHIHATEAFMRLCNPEFLFLAKC